MPANASDVSQAHGLFRADAGYAGMGKREEFRRSLDLMTMSFQISASSSSMRVKGGRPVGTGGWG